MSTSIRYLRLYLHTSEGRRRPIGFLSSYGDIYRVSFDEAYVSDKARPTLSLSYRGQSDEETQAILRSERDERVSRTDGKWPVFFQNLLPEGHNRERLAQERQCGTDDEFELLAAAGHDLMGGVEVEPVPRDEGIPNAVRLWHTTIGKDVLEPGFVENPVEDAAAIPGVVTKFSALQEGRRYVIKRHGAAGDAIIKLPTTVHPQLVDNELMGYTLLASLGIDCAKAHKISKEDADLPAPIPFPFLLAVQRFDRGANGQRIHMEEFAQIMQFAPKHKYGKNLVHDYASILRILDKLSEDPARDTAEFVSRFIAFILMGNTDAHLKNWAVTYPNGRDPKLSPAYDPVCVSALFDEVSKHDYGINRRIDQAISAMSWNDVENLLTQARVLRPERLLAIAKKTMQDAKRLWPELLEAAPTSVKKEVLQRLAGQVLLAR